MANEWSLHVGCAGSHRAGGAVLLRDGEQLVAASRLRRPAPRWRQAVLLRDGERVVAACGPRRLEPRRRRRVVT